MPTRAEITPEVLRALLIADFEQGRLWWRERPPGSPFFQESHAIRFNRELAGFPAFATPRNTGYLGGEILGIKIEAHRVLWAMSNGRWPVALDHIDGDPHNNARSNLREASPAVNNRNQAKRANNTSGATGVVRRGARWGARISDGITPHKHLGVFDTFEEAVAARRAAEASLGYHANHGREARMAA